MMFADTIDQINHTISKTTKHLLSKLDSRVKYFSMIDYILDRKSIVTAYYPRKDYIYFACDLPTIEHEISHMVEINESRTLLPDWGLKTFSNLDKETTSAIVAGAAREVRVRAIQAHLFDVKPDKIRTLADNPAWPDSMISRCPYGKFKSRTDFVTWIEDLHEKTYKAWNIDKIESIWNNRVEYIFNWMETVD